MTTTTITISYCLSKSGQRAAANAGLDARQRQSRTVTRDDVTPDQWRALVDMATFDGDGNGAIALPSPRKPQPFRAYNPDDPADCLASGLRGEMSFDDPAADVVALAIRHTDHIAAVEAAAIEEFAESARIDARDRASRWLAERPADLSDMTSTGKPQPFAEHLERLLADDLAAAVERRHAERVAAWDQRRAEQDRADAAKRAEAEAGRQRLREWAQSNGSDLLRARIAHADDGVAWDKLARREYADSLLAPLGEPLTDVPDGYSFYESVPARTPDIEELAALDAVREWLAGRTDITAELECFRYDRDDRDGYDDGDDDPDQTLRRIELRVTVAVPDGTEQVRDYLPTDVLAALRATTL